MKQIQDSVKLRCFSTLWFITQVWIEAYQVCGVLGSNITSSSFLLSDELVPNPVGHTRCSGVGVLTGVWTDWFFNILFAAVWII